jgi:hypothetical protein
MITRLVLAVLLLLAPQDGRRDPGAPLTRLTPGSVLTRRRAIVCAPGYASHVRSVSAHRKDSVFVHYGILAGARRAYVIDHLIPLELGGSNLITNLFPQDTASARAKDPVLPAPRTRRHRPRDEHPEQAARGGGLSGGSMTTETIDVQAPAFEEFTKIARLSRACVVTEKIDGTNAQVCVLEDGRVLAGSRNRWITPDADNFGFARWVAEHEAELRDGLGVGRHYGEWWGSGIQRGYGLVKGEKRFSLFNVARWLDTRSNEQPVSEKQSYAPPCCHVVPTLYAGMFDTHMVSDMIHRLAIGGSIAAPGFMDPEGVVVWHDAARVLFKKTLMKDEVPKGRA